MKVSALSGCLLCVLFTVLHSCFPNDVILSLAITAGTISYHFVMRLAVGWIISLLFKGRLDPDSVWFRRRNFEQKLYRLMRIRRWKNKMPTYNPREFSFTENTPEEIIQNSCVAELVHEVIALASFLPLFASLIWGVFPVFLITSIVSAGVDCCFVIMQRYNRPRLQQYLKRRKAAAPDRRSSK